MTKVEPWGSTDDYCGDGSCGISHPDDIRWVLKYTVSVPDSATEPLDPTSCPGELHIVNGNDDESIVGVSGAYARGLDDSIFPGATKFGVAEYSVEKAASGQEFYIESTCGGDPAAHFVGSIAQAP